MIGEHFQYSFLLHICNWNPTLLEPRKINTIKKILQKHKSTTVLVYADSFCK